MKIRALFAAGSMIAAMAGPSFAFDLTSKLDGGLLHGVSCNVNDEDKQAQCMRNCDDEYIKASQAYSTAGNLEGPKADKKACDTKCGC